MTPVERVLELVEEVGNPKKMTKLEYVEFMDELMVELQIRTNLVQGELDDDAELEPEQ